MSLSPAQLQTLKAAIVADNTLNNLPNNGDGNFAIADAMNALASPNFYVLRTNVSRSEIYNLTSVDATTWDWSKYKSQSVTEQNAWTQMFMGDQADFSQANLRAGIANIFTSASAVNAIHAFAIGKRLARRIEKLFGTQATNGNGIDNTKSLGATQNPALMRFEGTITGSDVEQARNLP